jgi:hypothetical protein
MFSYAFASHASIIPAFHELGTENHKKPYNENSWRIFETHLEN